MADIALAWSLEAGAADILLDDDDIATDAGLRTAVLLSLFTDRSADDAEVLPRETDDRRGWWADEFAEPENDRMGSLLWLLDGAKLGENVEARVVEMVREALAWMVEDRVASSIDVDVDVASHVLRLVVTVNRPSADAVSFRFAHTWDAEESNAV